MIRSLAGYSALLVGLLGACSETSVDTSGTSGAAGASAGQAGTGQAGTGGQGGTAASGSSGQPGGGSAGTSAAGSAGEGGSAGVGGEAGSGVGGSGAGGSGASGQGGDSSAGSSGQPGGGTAGTSAAGSAGVGGAAGSAGVGGAAGSAGAPTCVVAGTSCGESLSWEVVNDMATVTQELLGRWAHCSGDITSSTPTGSEGVEFLADGTLYFLVQGQAGLVRGPDATHKGTWALQSGTTSEGGGMPNPTLILMIGDNILIWFNMAFHDEQGWGKWRPQSTGAPDFYWRRANCSG